MVWRCRVVKQCRLLKFNSENITLHGQHLSEDKNGFESSEFKKVIKLPQGVDPTSVTSRVSADGGALFLEGIKRGDRYHRRYAVQLDLSGFKPEDVKIQRRGQELIRLAVSLL